MKLGGQVLLVVQGVMLLAGIGVVAYAISIPDHPLSNPTIPIVLPLMFIAAGISVARLLRIRAKKS